MADSVIMTIDAPKLTELMQSCGFRTESFVDSNGAPCVRSATAGAAFTVRLGNRAMPPVEGFTDFTCIALVKLMEGEFPAKRLNEWNMERRFCKLHRRDDFLVLDFDVLLAGGVTEAYLRTAFTLWDRLLQELVLFLRGESGGEAARA